MFYGTPCIIKTLHIYVGIALLLSTVEAGKNRDKNIFKWIPMFYEETFK